MKSAESDRTVDLHAHTTASDGDRTPTELVAEAHALGLTALAITDHDTTAGAAEGLRAAAALGNIEVVPGIELSAEIDRGQCHILGLFIDPESRPLLARLGEVLHNRAVRNGRIVEKLQALGYEITIDDVRNEARGDVLARPHFARVLVDRGYAASMQDAFDRLLAKGAAAYVERDRLTPSEAIALIHSAGGVAILAHPNNLKRDRAETEEQIARLQRDGLDGIEARYNLHSPEDTAFYLDLAGRMGLCTGGGSDFHGRTVKPNVKLGHVEGDSPAPRAVLEDLRSRAAALRV